MTIYTDADQRRSGSGDRPTSSRPSRSPARWVSRSRARRPSRPRSASTWTPIRRAAPPPENPPRRRPDACRSHEKAPRRPEGGERGGLEALGRPRTVGNRLPRSSRPKPVPSRAPERADRVGRWAQGHPKPGQIRGQRPSSSRMEPGAAGLSGRDEAFGAESSFQALRGHGRGHVGVERGQTPPNSTKSTSRVPGSGSRISLPFCGFPVSSGRPRATKRYGDGVGNDPPSA